MSEGKNREAFVSRTALLLGRAGVERLAAARVAVFGLGGVGGAACEALARAGVGSLTLFDDDVIAHSNRNRQGVALCSTVGQKKVEAMARRVADINPDCEVRAFPVFYLPQNADDYPLAGYDYVVDAVDTVSAKVEIIQRAKAAGVPVISAMGAGNKLRPECFEVADIAATSVCPLARVMRRELKKRGITGVQAVYSKEPPCPLLAARGPDVEQADPTDRPGRPKEHPPGSVSFVPAAAGLVLAGAVVRGLLGLE